MPTGRSRDPGEGAVTNRELRAVGTPEAKSIDEMKGIRARVHACEPFGSLWINP